MLFEAPDAQEGDVESVRVLELPPLPVPSHAIVPFRFPSNAMIFLNGSSQPVFVRIIGPTRNRFWVSSGEALGVHVAPGEHYVKLRYGAPEIGPQPGMEPHQYTYFRGESFAIEEGSSPPSSQPNIILDPIPGTLRINPGGELKTTPISPEEFEHD